MAQYGWFLAGGLAVAAIASPLTAQKSNPAVVQKVLDCRTVEDSAARLACYDHGVAALVAAREGGEVVVFDREEVRKTKKGLFGFNLSDLPIFGRKDGKKEGDDAPDREEVQEIVAKVASAAQRGDGNWVLTLDSGARWEQIQAMTFGRNPRAGSTVTIKRAAFGSYKMKVDQNPAVKARRTG